MDYRNLTPNEILHYIEVQGTDNEKVIVSKCIVSVQEELEGLRDEYNDLERNYGRLRDILRDISRMADEV